MLNEYLINCICMFLCLCCCSLRLRRRRRLRSVSSAPLRRTVCTRVAPARPAPSRWWASSAAAARPQSPPPRRTSTRKLVRWGTSASARAGPSPSIEPNTARHAWGVELKYTYIPAAAAGAGWPKLDRDYNNQATGSHEVKAGGVNHNWTELGCIYNLR